MKNAIFLAIACFAVVIVPGKSWHEFGDWSDCIAPGGCGYGFEIKSRTCNDTSCADAEPYGYAETRSCFEVPCENQSSILQPWKNWSACEASCGNSTRLRVRTCLPSQLPGSTNCTGPFYEEEICTNGDCPQYNGGDCYDVRYPEQYHGNISEAGNGRPCVAWDHPDSAYQPSNANLTVYKLGEGPFCRNPNKEIRPWCYFEKRDNTLKKRRCDVALCNMFSYWSEWSCWSPWSATCGDATRKQTRYCINGRVGDPGCQGSAVNVEMRSVPSCPKTCYMYSV